MLPIGTVIAYAGPWSESLYADGWMECDGREVDISTSTEALYQVLNNRYGGEEGKSFRLPDMRGRFLLGSTQETGDAKGLGECGGEEETQLTAAQVPAHQHTLAGHHHKWHAANRSGNYGLGQATNAEFFNAQGTMIQGSTQDLYTDFQQADQTRETIVTQPAAVHNNMPPYLAINFLIRYANRESEEKG